MSNVFVDKTKIDNLANAISVKSGESVPMTLTEMTQAVDGIDTSGGGGGTPNLQTKSYTVDSAGTETITADVGYDGLSEVEVSVPSAEPHTGFVNNHFFTENNQRKWSITTFSEVDVGEGDIQGWLPDGFRETSDYVVNAVPANTTITPTTSSQTIGGANYMMEGAVTVSAMPSGTAGTPTATKGTVSNHSVSVTPSVTNTTGYITGSTKTGTAVTVSASELVSGDKSITANGNNIDVANYSTVSVNVSGGTSKNVQVLQSTSRTNASSLTKVLGDLTVSKTGTYDVYWSGGRSNTSSSYTWGTRLYVDGSGYGTENTSWSNNCQSNHLSNVSLTANQKLSVYARGRTGSYYTFAPMLVIIEA